MANTALYRARGFSFTEPHKEMAPATLAWNDSEATCGLCRNRNLQGKGTSFLARGDKSPWGWAGKAGGAGKQEEQEGSTGFPRALCGVTNTQSLAQESCQSTRCRLQPGHLMPSFFLLKWAFQPERKEHWQEGNGFKYSFGFKK